ncbi:MAG: hypothetical protein KF795_15505 [Labilithrix sp.]|nr:hypothetical protein [Labilithrix sp.]
MAYSVTLTSRAGDAATIRAKLGELVRIIARRAPRQGFLGSIDRAPKTGRWHVHALVLAPSSFDITKLLAWWRRLWPWKNSSGAYERPSAQGQKVRPLASSNLDNDLRRVLAHHLGTSRMVKGQRVPVTGLPPLHERVAAYGALARVWERVSDANGIAVACAWGPPRKRPSRAKKVSTKPLPPNRTWSAGVSCAWCGKALAIGKRKDARCCGRTCGSAASRALCTFEKRMGAHASTARARVLALEERGWLRRDAIHAVSTAFVKATKEGKPIVTVKIKPPACRCGRPLASRSDARTCGRGACRSKAYRRRQREQRRRQRTAMLFTQLLRRWRWQPFSVTEARAMGASLHLRQRHVEELLRQLVEEDGLAFVLVGAPDHYAFILPHARRLAA